MNHSTPGASRPLRIGLALVLPATLIALLLLVEPTRLDFAISDLFYRPGVGFAGKHSYWLENVLHDRAKQGVILIGVLAIAGLLASWLHRPWAAWRRPLGYVVLANPVEVIRHPHGLEYATVVQHPLLWAVLYIIAVIGAPLLSGYRSIVAFGVANLAGLILVAVFYVQAFASLWCVFAAASSLLMLVHMYRRRRLPDADRLRGLTSPGTGPAR